MKHSITATVAARESVPERIARETGYKPRSVRRFLRERFPSHHIDTWWKDLSEKQIQETITELLDALEQKPKQPRKWLKMPQQNRGWQMRLML